MKVLLDGRRHFRAKKHRAFAVRLLTLALQIDPDIFETSFELAKLRRLEGDPAGASRILEKLAMRYRGRKLRRIRGVQFRMSPGIGSGLRWLKALATGR